MHQIFLQYPNEGEFNSTEEVCVKKPIQLCFSFIGFHRCEPKRFRTEILKSLMLKTARKTYKVGEEFLWSEFALLCESEGIYPEDEQSGIWIGSSHMTDNGFIRLGEAPTRSKKRSRAGAKDSIWKRVR